MRNATYTLGNYIYICTTHKKGIYKKQHLIKLKSAKVINNIHEMKDQLCIYIYTKHNNDL